MVLSVRRARLRCKYIEMRRLESSLHVFPWLTSSRLNQLLAGVHIGAAAEVLAFAKSLGLSTRETHRIVMASVGASWIFGDRGITMLNADWTPRSAVTIFTKDLVSNSIIPKNYTLVAANSG